MTLPSGSFTEAISLPPPTSFTSGLRAGVEERFQALLDVVDVPLG